MSLLTWCTQSEHPAKKKVYSYEETSEKGMPKSPTRDERRGLKQVLAALGMISSVDVLISDIWPLEL